MIKGLHSLQRSFSIVALSVIILFLVAPATHAVDYLPIVQCGTEKDASGNVSNPCGVCDIFKVGKNVIDFGFFALAPTAMVIALLAGGSMMILSSTNPKMLGRGQTIITHSFMGLAIVLFSWVFINTIIKTFAPNQDPSKPWYTFKCIDLEQLVTIDKNQLPADRFKAVLDVPKVTETPYQGQFTSFSGNKSGLAAQIAEAEWRKNVCVANSKDYIFTTYGNRNGALEAPNGLKDWCGAFLTYVDKQAGINWGVSNSFYVPTIWSEWKGKKITPSDVASGKETIQPGDLILYRDSTGVHYHIEMVTAYNPTTKNITTIGGNAGGYLPDGSDGGATKDRRCVAKKTFPFSAGGQYDFVRPAGGEETAAGGNKSALSGQGTAFDGKKYGLDIRTNPKRNMNEYEPLMREYSKRHYGDDTAALNPSYIILHSTESSGFPDNLVTETTYAKETPGRSCHFVVQGNTIYQLVPTNIRARCAFGANHVALGIEMVGYENPAKGPAVPESALSTTAKLVAALMKEYNIPLSRVIGHKDVSYASFQQSTKFPDYKDIGGETYKGEVRTDPGDKNMDAILQKLK